MDKYLVTFTIARPREIVSIYQLLDEKKIRASAVRGGSSLLLEGNTKKMNDIFDKIEDETKRNGCKRNSNGFITRKIRKIPCLT